MSSLTAATAFGGIFPRTAILLAPLLSACAVAGTARSRGETAPPAGAADAVRPSPPSEPAQVHVVTAESPAAGPTLLERLQARIDDAEAGVRAQGARGPRAVLHDAAGASDQAEHDAILDGVLVMVLVTAADRDEIPLRGLFIVDERRRTRLALARIAYLPDDVAQRLKLSGAIGTFRSASVYWLPFARHFHGHLEADFAVHRDGFVVGALDVEALIGQFADNADIPSSEVGMANVMAVKAMVEREYEGFVFDAIASESSNASESSGTPSRN